MSVAGLEVRLAAPGEVTGFNAMLAAHHYLGHRGSGRLLRYVALLDGEPVVLATFGSAAWKCRAREEFLGWDDEQRAARLPLVAGWPAPRGPRGMPPGADSAGGVVLCRVRHRMASKLPGARAP